MDMKAKTLLDMIARAKEVREQFICTGREIAEFAYAKEHTKVHAEMGHKENPFRATVAKTAEYLENVGPALYQSNPDRRVISRPWASPEAQARNALMQDLLNYTPKECQLEDHSRRAINQALIYGAGVLWTGYNPRKRLVQSVWDSVEHLLLDPDAGVPEEITWGARERNKPKHWLRERFPDKLKEIAAIQCEPGQKVKLYEVYCKIGLHNFAPESRYTDGAPTPEDTPRKYVITDDGKLLSEGDWEVPYFIDDKWPWELVYFRDGQGENGKEYVWPVSPLQPGLGFQKALDWIYTWYLTKASQTTGTVLALIRQNGQGIDLDAFKRAMATARTTGRGVLEIEINGEQMDFQKFIQEFNLTAGIDEFERFVGIVERAFERATGLTEFVSMGQTQNQFRSAAEAEVKDRNSRTRFEDMRQRVEAWCSRVARKEAQASRFLLEGQDVGRIFGPEAEQLWGVLVPPMQIQLAQGMEQAALNGITDRSMAFNFAQEQIINGVVYEEWMLETDFEIESGTTQAKNIQQQQTAADDFMNQGAAALFSAGFPVPALMGMKAWATTKNMPQEFIDSIDMAVQQAQMPPPPPPGMPGDPTMGDPSLLPPQVG